MKDIRNHKVAAINYAVRQLQSDDIDCVEHVVTTNNLEMSHVLAYMRYYLSGLTPIEAIRLIATIEQRI